MCIEKLKNISLDEVVDIRDVKINNKLSKKEKIIDYIKQIKNHIFISIKIIEL